MYILVSLAKCFRSTRLSTLSGVSTAVSTPPPQVPSGLLTAQSAEALVDCLKAELCDDLSEEARTEGIRACTLSFIVCTGAIFHVLLVGEARMGFMALFGWVGGAPYPSTARLAMHAICVARLRPTSTPRLRMVTG